MSARRLLDTHVLIWTADLDSLLHKDPFDRMLVAQALCESMTLLTNDEALKPYTPTVRVI